MEAEKSDAPASGYDPGKSESQPAQAKPATDSAGSEGEGDSDDEFGYEALAKTEGKKNEKGEGDKKPEPPAPAKEAEATSGYGAEPPVVPPTPPAPVEEVKLDYDVDVKDLPAEETPKLKEFLKNNKLNKAQADAVVANRKEFYAAQAKAQTDFQADQAREEAKIKSAWHHELKSDPTFGNENFGKNVKMVERVVEDFMPGTKKMLTERKSMLPPYVMRDLLKLGEQLYGTGSLVQGQPHAPKEDAEMSDDDLLKDMYK